MSIETLFLTGQRVIVRGEIGTVVDPNGLDPLGGKISKRVITHQEMQGVVWVYLPSLGYASWYAGTIIQRLPGGQL